MPDLKVGHFLYRYQLPSPAYYLPWRSLDTVSFARPFALRAANTLRPLAVDIRSRNPCLFTRLRL